MHRIFRKALDDATGVAQSVIAVIIDIRDFSGFSQRCDSVDVAIFIKRVYIRLIDDYFPFASFYKSTGDGLILIVPIGKKNLPELSQEVIASCIKCHAEFGNICSEDIMITFKVPDKIGIGIARGTTCCLVSEETMIDYSGRLLNLTSRLTDLARPSGIVIDGGFNIGLLSKEQRAIFKEENVYLKGIHEDKPIKIYFTPKFTSIPEYNRQPIAAKRRRQDKTTIPYNDIFKMRSLTTQCKYPLESEPASPDDITVRVEHAAVYKGRVQPKYTAYFYIDYFGYSPEGDTPYMAVNLKELCEALKRNGVKKSMVITFFTEYFEK